MIIHLFVRRMLLIFLQLNCLFIKFCTDDSVVIYFSIHNSSHMIQKIFIATADHQFSFHAFHEWYIWRVFTRADPSAWISERILNCGFASLQLQLQQPQCLPQHVIVDLSVCVGRTWLWTTPRFVSLGSDMGGPFHQVVVLLWKFWWWSILPGPFSMILYLL